jgi:hypothetical protein
MNSRLEEAIERIKALPDHRQQEVAAMLFELLDVEQNPELTCHRSRLLKLSNACPTMNLCN